MEIHPDFKAVLGIFSNKITILYCQGRVLCVIVAPNYALDYALSRHARGLICEGHAYRLSAVPF